MRSECDDDGDDEAAPGAHDSATELMDGSPRTRASLSQECGMRDAGGHVGTLCGEKEAGAARSECPGGRPWQGEA